MSLVFSRILIPRNPIHKKDRISCNQTRKKNPGDGSPAGHKVVYSEQATSIRFLSISAIDRVDSAKPKQADSGISDGIWGNDETVQLVGLRLSILGGREKRNHSARSKNFQLIDSHFDSQIKITSIQ